MMEACITYFPRTIFNEDGQYIINPEYSLDDFDIIAKYTTADAAWNEAERLNQLSEKDRY